MPLGLLFAAAVSMQAPSEATRPPANEPYCEWSAVWTQLPHPQISLNAKLTPPKRKKGRIERPASLESREIVGQWIVQVVIDQEGQVRDAAFIKRPQVDPPWPEFEGIIMKSIRKFKYSPARADGTPIPLCLTLPLHQKWHDWE